MATTSNDPPGTTLGQTTATAPDSKPITETNPTTTPPETKSQAESLLPLFIPTRPLRQTDHTRTLTLLGKIHTLPALLTLERASLPTSPTSLSTLLTTLTSTTNLGANDIYRWYMSNSLLPSHPNLKLNLIWPCTEGHVAKYSTQRIRWVTETSEVYVRYVKPWIERTQRGKGRLGWIWNVLDGITEQEDVVYRSAGMGGYQREDRGDSTGFLLLPDLNWDRRGVEGLHLLAIVERRDLWSLRGLKRRDVGWLRSVRGEAVRAAAGVARGLLGEAARVRAENTGGEEDGGDGDGGDDVDVDEDQFKCYVHYQPTYYHFHVHVVHVMLEAGATQAVGKAFSLDLLIEMLEAMGSEERGLDEISLGYTVGEESELWKKCFLPLKKGERVTLNDV